MSKPLTFIEAMFIGMFCMKISGAIDWSWVAILGFIFGLILLEVLPGAIQKTLKESRK